MAADTSGRAGPRIVADGHVHITNRVYWEGIDPWRPQPFGFDYVRAATAGVNVVIENVAPYGFRSFNYTSSLTRAARDHGEFGQWLDEQMRARHRAAFRPWTEFPGADAVVPTADDWAAHVQHVIDTVGPDHAGIGLDLVGGRGCVPQDARGYPDLIAALDRITSAENVDKVAGENWLRVLAAAGPESGGR